MLTTTLIKVKHFFEFSYYSLMTYSFVETASIKEKKFSKVIWVMMVVGEIGYLVWINMMQNAFTANKASYYDTAQL